MDDIEKIRRLVSLVSDNKLAELELEEPEFRVKIKNRGSVQYWPAPSSATPAGGQEWSHPQSGYQQEHGAGESDEAESDNDGMVEIVSPMVGTFYRASSESGEPYVTVGDTVEPDTVVCIVEAMKVMNEVKAEVSGVVEEILIQNAEPVEYNQVLFLVRPSDESTGE